MSPAARSLVVASDPVAAHAGMQVLPKGNAVDAVVAAVLAAAATWPHVLLGPVQVLVAGAGAGKMAYDGRTLQPGLGAERPRGFLPEEPVPATAFAGVPLLPATLAALLAATGGLTWKQAMAPALDAAKAHGARKGLFKILAQQGSSALTMDAVGEELTHALGPVGGGTLTAEDIDRARPIVTTASTRLADPWEFSVMPSDEESPDPAPSDSPDVVIAADVRGMVAVAAYGNVRHGAQIDALGLVAPRTAAPVRRGETRVRPGSICPASRPIAIASGLDAVLVGLGLTGATAAELLLADVLDLLPNAPSVDDAIAGARGEEREGTRGANVGRVHGILSTRRGPHGLTDPRTMSG
jgi:hypothetical protein